MPFRRPPSKAFQNIIPAPDPKPLFPRQTPTALEYAVSLINSSPLVLFARRQCIDSKKLQKRLALHQHEYRLVYLEDIKLGNIIQRRLCDLTGQRTVPNLFAKSQSIGGLRDSIEALQLGKVDEILMADEWTELVYAVRPDALARGARIEPKSRLSLEMCLQDSHKFNYVHRSRWDRIKRYWGLHPEIEEYPITHKYLERPRTARKW
ncbi:Glutaredoxin [Coemansia sp. RSA 2611]|nr:Glutaredoxin [Coemansia sp. RSA 2611]